MSSGERNYFLPGTIASFATLATRIFTTVLAGILMGSPVAGLRPIRAFLLTKASFPIPRRKGSAFLGLGKRQFSDVLQTFFIKSNMPNL